MWRWKHAELVSNSLVHFVSCWSTKNVVRVAAHSSLFRNQFQRAVHCPQTDGLHVPGHRDIGAQLDQGYVVDDAGFAKPWMYDYLPRTCWPYLG